MTRSNGAPFFDRDYGLRVGRLADAVRELGPVMVDDDDRLWVYGGGVWRPDSGDIRRRAVLLLGERTRDTHLRNLRTFLAGDAERFTVAPVSSYINLAGGMLRWGASPDPELVDHHPEYMSTVQLPVQWDPLATCPEFEAFMEAALPEDDRDRAWQVLGYLMMSGNPLQRLFLLTGSGGNGKGVFLNVVRALLGEANVTAIPLQEFSENRFSTAELFGKLANVCGDIDATFIHNTGRIKELSGDDKMKGERKGEHPFYFKFWGKAIFSANAIPGASDSSKGWLRRWEVLQFPYAPTKVDPDLPHRLTTPASLAGIANKAIFALRQLMRDHEFMRGESAHGAHAEFAEKSNRVIRWLNDADSNVERDDTGLFNKGTILLQAFREWEEHDSGDRNRHTGVQTFNELARQAGLVPTVRRGNRGYTGARVTRHVFIKDQDRPWLNYQTGQIGSAPPESEPTQGELL